MLTGQRRPPFSLCIAMEMAASPPTSLRLGNQGLAQKAIPSSLKSLNARRCAHWPIATDRHVRCHGWLSVPRRPASGTTMLLATGGGSDARRKLWGTSARKGARAKAVSRTTGDYLAEARAKPTLTHNDVADENDSVPGGAKLHGFLSALFQEVTCNMQHAEAHVSCRPTNTW